jgi:hypothetical protein
VLVVGRIAPRTLAQHLLEIGRAQVLLQQIAERFVRQFLQRFHTIERQAVEGLPGLTVKDDALAYRT